MHNACVIRLEGIDTPCLLLRTGEEVPEELVVDFGDKQHGELPRGSKTFRLEPSSTSDPQPQYRELFEE